jgi:hypothetical protein
LLALIGVVVVGLASRGTFAPFTVSIPGGGVRTRDYTFKANSAYEFILTSDPVSDVDIYITDFNDQPLRSGNLTAADVTVGPNGRIVWVFAAPGVYRVKIHNIGPAQNRSTVTIRELGPGRAIEVPAFGNAPNNFAIPMAMLPPAGPVGPPIALGNGQLQRTLPMLGLGQQCEFMVTYPVAKRVTVDVTTIQRDTDVDLHIFEIGGRTFSDTSIGPDSHLAFDAQAARTYRFRVIYVGRGQGAANSTITYTSP